MSRADEPGFGIYVHWPFCAAKCPYCDFNSHVRQGVDQDRWARALVAELEHRRDLTGPRQVDSVFFGGGTPSLMMPGTVSAVLDAIARLWPVDAYAEVTLEANPTSVEASRFSGYAAAGVNRVSVGVQALRDDALRRLGRLHSAAEARAALETARGLFPRASIDLIYARQDQRPGDWRQELEEALDWGLDHLSLYQLTIEPGTAFGARHAAGGLHGLPDEDAAAEMFAITQEVCAAAGRPGYEISNHAAPGSEGRHNLIYWRYGAYAGVGPGAHGRHDTGGVFAATETVLSPERWLTVVEQAGHGLSSVTAVPPAEQAEEYLMMALRLAEGASLRRHRSLGGAALPDARITDLTAQGMLARTGDRIRATDAGRPVLNAVLRGLLA